MTKITFGTSGWRALYHEDFIRSNVELVCQAIADEVRRNGVGEGVAIGYDVRFMGKEFAQLAASIMAGNDIRAWLVERDVPTPVLSHAIVSRKLAGGINFTASHNPFTYNGIKYSPESGGPALPEATERIEARIRELQRDPTIKKRPFEAARREGLIEMLDPRPDYLEALSALVQTKQLRGLGERRIAIDCKHSVARGYLDRFLSNARVRVYTMNDKPDPYFGFEHPEPSRGYIDGLQKYVANHEDVALGLACDGDADRFGIVDEDGSFVEANLILALLLDYLAESRGWTGGVARSVATTHLMDRVATSRGLTLHETPVGFKYIGDMLTKGEIVFGGEESAGMTIAGHLPEKDGILACILVAEMVAATGKTLQQLTSALFERVGTVLDVRDSLRLTPEVDAAFDEKIAKLPPELGGRPVVRIDRTDGTKLFFEGDDWVLLRKSGTEPLVRIYAEASSGPVVDSLIDACKSWLSS